MIGDVVAKPGRLAVLERIQESYIEKREYMAQGHGLFSRLSFRSAS